MVRRGCYVSVNLIIYIPINTLVAEPVPKPATGQDPGLVLYMSHPTIVSLNLMQHSHHLLVFKVNVSREVYSIKLCIHCLPSRPKYPAHRILYFIIVSILNELYTSQCALLNNILNSPSSLLRSFILFS